MTTFTLGPLALSWMAMPWLALLLSAWLTTVWRRRSGRADAEPLLWWLLTGALVGARLAFVGRYWDQYGLSWALIDIRDGGWWWPGGVAGAVVGAALGWPRHRQAGGELLRTLAVGAVVAVPVLATVMAFSGVRPMAPDVALQDLQGRPAGLLDDGPSPLTVVNLWATWCPPCRREMPVLQRGQQHYPEVDFVYVNQGESSARIRSYLTDQSLRLQRVLADPHSDLLRALGSSALPTTVLIDARGRLVGSHVGPLSDASLRHLLAPYIKE
ncbi:prolipoprotein diacylglyceryl transferase family protein [Alloalcanivorax xenomutans]|uniref:TlpA family protein disulfide reductase n=1 Tax=Alloalcanivorax xenomutans TaxID=1094342 RepID=UPI003D9B4485